MRTNPRDHHSTDTGYPGDHDDRDAPRPRRRQRPVRILGAAVAVAALSVVAVVFTVADALDRARDHSPPAGATAFAARPTELEHRP